MQGIVVFTSVAEAQRHGFEIFDRTQFGYLCRIRTSAGWAMAEIHLP